MATDCKTEKYRINILDPFSSYDSSRAMMDGILAAVVVDPLLDDPTILLLAVEAVFRLEDVIQRYQLKYNNDFSKTFTHILREWRSCLNINYSIPHGPAVLKCLKCFQEMTIPLFFDDQSIKLPLSDNEGHFEGIDIGDTSRVSLYDDEVDFPYKNIMKGAWYNVLDSNRNNLADIKIKTLRQLAVRGLSQGEIVYHPTKNVVNVILYQCDSKNSFEGLRKPSLDAVRKKFGESTQITLSIVVPRDGSSWEVNKQLSSLSGEKNNDQVSSIDAPDKIVSSFETSNQMVKTERLDLVNAITSAEGCRSFLTNLIEKLSKIQDPAIALLALEGLCRIWKDVSSKIETHSLPDTVDKYPCIETLRDFLKLWQFTSHIEFSYSGRSSRLLRSLTVFKILQVPLFIDDYGDLKLLHSLDDKMEDVLINAETPIIHVTHEKEAKLIADQRKYKPSDNKNSIPGTWFGVWKKQESVYGSKGFITTLKQLGVKGLYQGEFVYYKNERNCILYATDDVNATFNGLKKVVCEDENYAAVSIFVPSRFLPPEEEFWNVNNEFVNVTHGPFCVKEKREHYCPDNLKRKYCF